jgi:hypothetical protein
MAAVTANPHLDAEPEIEHVLERDTLVQAPPPPAARLTPHARDSPAHAWPPTAVATSAVGAGGSPDRPACLGAVRG